eukprot:COSAG01_NODE_403_length_17482_cov_77.249597_23_plen_57_part_00
MLLLLAAAHPLHTLRTSTWCHRHLRVLPLIFPHLKMLTIKQKINLYWNLNQKENTD